MSGLTEALHGLAARLDRADWSALLHDDHKTAHDGAVALEDAEARLARAESIIAEKNDILRRSIARIDDFGNVAFLAQARRALALTLDEEQKP